VNFDSTEKAIELGPEDKCEWWECKIRRRYIEQFEGKVEYRQEIADFCKLKECEDEKDPVIVCNLAECEAKQKSLMDERARTKKHMPKWRPKITKREEEQELEKARPFFDNHLEKERDFCAKCKKVMEKKVNAENEENVTLSCECLELEKFYREKGDNTFTLEKKLFETNEKYFWTVIKQNERECALERRCYTPWLFPFEMMHEFYELCPYSECYNSYIHALRLINDRTQRCDIFEKGGWYNNKIKMNEAMCNASETAYYKLQLFRMKKGKPMTSEWYTNPLNDKGGKIKDFCKPYRSEWTSRDDDRRNAILPIYSPLCDKDWWPKHPKCTP